MTASLVGPFDGRSEEHTSELQSRPHLVCRLLLEKKNNVVMHRARRSEDRSIHGRRYRRRARMLGRRHHRPALPPVRPNALNLSFFFNDTATTEIYTLSLHDALPI